MYTPTKAAIKRSCRFTPAVRQAVRTFREKGSLSSALQTRAELELLDGESSPVPDVLLTSLAQLADSADARFQNVVRWSKEECGV